jgi:photosystem II stability/assembly factor-like uncharacterized protein
VLIEEVVKMKKVVFLVVVVFLALGFELTVLAEDLVWENIGKEFSDLRAVSVDFNEPRIIYIGLKGGVFKSEDGGKNWRNILSVRGENRTVNYLLSDPQSKNFLYAATGNGLFFSSDQGRNWKRIFKGKNYFENECATLAVLPSAIYLGTKGGLFVSKDKGRFWSKETGKLGSSQILAIAYNHKEPNYIYIACVDGVFRTADAGKSWERIFVSLATENNSETEESDEDIDEEIKTSNIRYISIDSNNANYLYLATSRGVYKSQDKGNGWELLTDYGLLSRDIKSLFVSGNSEIYAVSESGIFVYGNSRWQELSLGLIADKIRFLTQDKLANLYAAGDKGLFKTSIAHFGNNNEKDVVVEYYKDEPKIQEVQQAAIKYAQVIDPERIENLRKQARLKAVLPDFSLDYDETVTSYSNTNTTRFAVGPAEWGVSLKWSLSDLIWSEQQRLIDSQVRLMVQLRDDILDEVTKIYFERLRVKMELDNLSIEDRKKRFEKELKLQELTASLDALTGGYFSGHLSSKIGS